MPPFIPGLKLSELFYHEAVKPILERDFPDLKHSAALLGSGSEVLGFDNAQSTDHNWGPRLFLFLNQADYGAKEADLDRALSLNLPHIFRGYPTSFGPPEASGSRLLEERNEGPVSHFVEIYTVGGFFEKYLGLDSRGQMSLADWLSLPEQRLLTVTAGGVWHDGLGELGPPRQKLAYWPFQIWLYLLSAQWLRISQEEPFMARCGVVGDELGSQLVAARLVRELMRLAFLLEKQYAPYTKWFGSSFSRLKSAAELGPILQAVLRGSDWQEREKHLSEAYQLVARQHNALNITEPMPTEVSYFHDRPYLVIKAETFASRIQATITDPAIKALPFPIGSVDQWADSTNILSTPLAYRKLTGMY